MDQWLEHRPEDSLFQASSAASMSRDTEENETEEYPQLFEKAIKSLLSFSNYIST